MPAQIETPKSATNFLKTAASAVVLGIVILPGAQALPNYTLLLSYKDGPLPNGSYVNSIISGPAGTPSDDVFLEIPSSISDGLYHYQGGVFSEIANSSQSIAGLPLWRESGGGEYGLFYDVAPTGQFVIIDHALSSGTSYTSLYYGTGPNFALVARTGSAAVGIGQSSIKTLPGIVPLLSANGHGVFTAQVTVPDSGQPGLTKDIGAVWRLQDGVLVAKDGDPAPGTAGATFANFWTDSANAANDSGRILTLAALTPNVGDAIGTNNEGIWLSDTLGGNLQLVLRQGAPAPGLPNTTIQSFHYLGSQLTRNGTPKINKNGTIAFVALTNTSNTIGRAIYLGSPGNLTPILKPTDPAPTLTPTETISAISTYYLNDGDQLLFLGVLTHNDRVNELNDEVAYLWNGSEWKLIAREGNGLPDAPGFSIGSFIDPSTSQLLAFGPLAQGSMLTAIRPTGSTDDFSSLHAILYFTESSLQTTAYEGQTIDLNGTPKLVTLLTHTERALAGSGHVVFRAFLGGSTLGSGSSNEAKILAASFGGAFPAPQPFASPTPKPTPGGGGGKSASIPPSITVAKKFTGKSGKSNLKGTVSTGVVKVEIKVGKGKFKPAKLAGTSWKFAAKKLKAGNNPVTIRATTAAGLSTTAKTKIVEK